MSIQTESRQALRELIALLPQADERWAGPECNLASAEDVVLHKLHWFQLGERVSERQWRDVLGVLKVQGARLDLAYLRRWATYLGVAERLDEALRAARAAGNARP